MLKLNQFIIVGGTGRNVGKTEFVCRLIERISQTNEVYALKVSAVFPDEVQFHGDHTMERDKQYLFEETNSNTNKDTARMLQAGASRVFYLRAEDAGIEQGFNDFLEQLPDNIAVVCESNSLAKLVKPALHIILTQHGKPIKERAKRQMETADLLVVSDGVSGFTELERLNYTSQGTWTLR